MSQNDLDSKHYHTYRNVRGRKGVMMCVDPDCTHYTTKSLIESKRVRCGKCSELFIARNEDLKYALLVCPYCHNGPKAERLRKLRDGAKKLAEALDVDLPKNSKLSPPTLQDILDAAEEAQEKPERIEL